MSEKVASVIDQQVKELDAIAKRTVQDFNTVFGCRTYGAMEGSNGDLASTTGGKK